MKNVLTLTVGDRGEFGLGEKELSTKVSVLWLVEVFEFRSFSIIQRSSNKASRSTSPVSMNKHNFLLVTDY